MNFKQENSPILISLGVPQLREMKVQNLEPRASFLRAPQQFCAIAVFIPPIRPGRKSEAEGVKWTSGRHIADEMAEAGLEPKPSNCRLLSSGWLSGSLSQGHGPCSGRNSTPPAGTAEKEDFVGKKAATSAAWVGEGAGI